jgi:hypothetical protein
LKLTKQEKASMKKLSLAAALGLSAMFAACDAGTDANSNAKPQPTPAAVATPNNTLPPPPPAASGSPAAATTPAADNKDKTAPNTTAAPAEKAPDAKDAAKKP